MSAKEHEITVGIYTTKHCRKVGSAQTVMKSMQMMVQRRLTWNTN